MTLADCTVMVVEDHEFQRRTMLQILANLGTGRLLEAADGESALALLSAEPRPDVVVCDLDMPGMDGVEFLRHVSERSIDTAIVIASGLGEGVLRSAETTARAYGLHVLGAVGKPLTARRLLEVVGLHRPARLQAGTPPRAGRAPALVRPRIDLLSGRPAGVLVEGDPDGVFEALGAVPGLDVTLLLAPSACEELTLGDRLAARAHAAGVDPRRICVALPHEPALPDSAAQLEVLTRLLVRGFGLGVHDFTAGDVALGRLQELPLTEVTLSRDALAGATSSPLRAEALEATIRGLRTRGARAVASGCDSDGERDLLAQMGCDRAEGAIAGGTLAPAELAAWAAAPA
jgi:CheY-like chemotaxis protein